MARAFARVSALVAPTLLCLLAGQALGGPEAAKADAVKGYYRFPTVHGETIVFASEGDLWKVDVGGGQATRLTSYQSNATYARFSPDGKWLAFTSNFEGNNDVCVMPAEGGVATRLTYHPANDQVVGWTPNSKAIIFRSQRPSPHGEQELYTVPVEGGPASRINVGIGALASFSADGKTLAFNRWSTEFRTWKRYRGGTAPDVWIGQIEKPETFHKLTNWEGTDDFPMFVGPRVFFLSDRDGRSNIWSCNPDGSDLKQHTHHKDFDARWPDNDDAAGPKGKIVYMLGADVWCLDLASGKDAKVDISLPSDRYFLRPKTESIAAHVERYDVSNDGTRVAIDGRGQVFVSPTKPGRVIQIARQPNFRDRSATLSPDGRMVAFITDQTGSQEIAIADVAAPGSTSPEASKPDAKHKDDKKADAKKKDAEKKPLDPVGGRKVLTSDGKGWIFDPVWSPDGRSIAYADMTFQLHLVDVATGQNKVIDQAKGWEIREYTFSPDSKWVAYTTPTVLDDGRASNRSEIKIYSLEQSKSWSISTVYASDSSPTWDPKGRYLYFLSNRSFNPTLDQNETNFIVMNTTKPYALVLRDGDLSPFSPRELLAARDKREKEAEEAKAEQGDSEKAEADKPESDKKDAKKKDGKKDAEKKEAKEEAEAQSEKDAPAIEVKIDTDDLPSRVVEFPVEAGNYHSLAAVDGKVFYLQVPNAGILDSDLGVEDDSPKNALQEFSFESRKADAFIESLRDYAISPDGSKIAWRVKDDIQVAGTEAKPEAGEADHSKGEKPVVSTEHLMTSVTPAEEWKQIYWEAWRLERDFYWTPDMAKLDWKAIGDQYATMLPRIGARQELNDVIGQLIGELGTSHTYVWGGDVPGGRRPISTGTLGAQLVPDAATGAWKIQRVLRPEVFENDIISPLTLPHARVKDGEYLWAIDGVATSAAEDVYKLLSGRGGHDVVLKVGSKADKSDAREIQIEALNFGEETQLSYADWCRRKRAYVEEKSGGRIGYFHMPDMGGAGLVKFVKGFYPQLGKQALIIDDRFNGGGFVSQMVIQRLRNAEIALGTSRYGPWDTYPAAAARGPKCVLINFSAGSDGDIFPDSFRAAGLGPVIGTRTWGGVVGIRGDKKFIDGGLSTQPEFSWLDPKRGWSIENHGVDPDIEIDNMPADEAADRDVQLDRAIEEMDKALKANPVPPIVQPPIPDKRPHGGGEWLKKP